MRHLFILLALLMFSPLYSIGQRMNDTLVMYIDQRMEMQVIIEDYKELKIDSNQQKLREQIESFQSILKDETVILDPNKAEMIVYTNQKELRVTPGDPTEIYLVEDGVKASGNRDMALIKTGEMQVRLITTDMVLFREISLLNCFDLMMQKIPEKTWLAKTLYFECINDDVMLQKDKEEVNSKGDQLEISLGGGINLYKGQWLGELGVRMDIAIFKKNVLKHNPYVSYTLLYDFTDLSKMHINSFLNLGYGWDRSKGEGDKNYFSVEVGYLLNRSGDLFEKNTSRIGINWSPLKGVTVSPQMYIIGGFEKVQPGFRIGLGF